MSTHELIARIDDETQQAILNEISEQSETFGKSPRTTYEGSAHAEVQDIILRGPVVEDTDTLLDLHQKIECTDYMDKGKFPVLSAAVDVFAEGRELGRVIITHLGINGMIYPHIDEGPVPEYYTRYHYCVQGGHGNVFLIGGAGINIETGDVYMIDVRNKHAVINMMNCERVHVIMDIKND